MSRGVGELAAVEALPEAVVVAAALLTQLGDVWFLFGLVGLLYWFGGALPAPVALGRRRAAFVVALGLGANALVTTLKEWLARPRPPGAGTATAPAAVPEAVDSLYVAAATGTGFGFPSGHALGTAAVYGGLALVVGTRRAYVTAAAVTVVVALTRVVLGVHYLVDVVVGAAVGAAFLAVVYRLCGRGSNPGRALMLAVAAALLGPVVGEYNFDTMAALGAALGARIAWGVVGDAVVREATTRGGGAVSAGVGAAFGVLFGVVYALEPAPHVAFLSMGVVLAGVLAAPLAGEAVARRV
ncbi:phosphatase PAP2 family protein [Natronomonas marina]|jgi:membrane-associated phospholipid phosphatase|uniref:phosphatase PAP2 family protein n=1 Tax=Natronomonas marina TaxID=2961939 RepID=UPI0020C9AB3A|nr:phosphatase PAP2 family protein [Natronomonas marina]